MLGQACASRYSMTALASNSDISGACSMCQNGVEAAVLHSVPPRKLGPDFVDTNGPKPPVSDSFTKGGFGCSAKDKLMIRFCLICGVEA